MNLVNVFLERTMQTGFVLRRCFLNVAAVDIIFTQKFTAFNFFIFKLSWHSAKNRIG